MRIIRNGRISCESDRFPFVERARGKGGGGGGAGGAGREVPRQIFQRQGREDRKGDKQVPNEEKSRKIALLKEGSCLSRRKQGGRGEWGISGHSKRIENSLP